MIKLLIDSGASSTASATVRALLFLYLVAESIGNFKYKHAAFFIGWKNSSQYCSKRESPRCVKIPIQTRTQHCHTYGRFIGKLNS